MIAGAGFAMMAWREAVRRAYSWPVDPGLFAPERMTERCSGAAEFCEHCEYYNILDKAWYAWNARANGNRFASLRVVL